eukprot:GHVU01108948.1.p1 GENE.GHVU01108948.1~~GHVU01108948.1.p1  ORF type:complete len:319 (+),score=28.55 GHVU01108948.1:1524-2480(+)
MLDVEVTPPVRSPMRRRREVELRPAPRLPALPDQSFTLRPVGACLLLLLLGASAAAAASVQVSRNDATLVPRLLLPGRAIGASHPPPAFTGPPSALRRRPILGGDRGDLVPLLYAPGGEEQPPHCSPASRCGAFARRRYNASDIPYFLAYHSIERPGPAAAPWVRWSDLNRDNLTTLDPPFGLVGTHRPTAAPTAAAAAAAAVVLLLLLLSCCALVSSPSYLLSVCAAMVVAVCVFAKLSSLSISQSQTSMLHSNHNSQAPTEGITSSLYKYARMHVYEDGRDAPPPPPLWSSSIPRAVYLFCQEPSSPRHHPYTHVG